MPTTPALIYTAARLEPFLKPEDARMIVVPMKAAAVDFACGTVLGQVTATGKFAAYSDAAGDGTEVARGILVYDIQVDGSGNITYSETALTSGGDWGQTTQSTPIYIAGTFLASELTGLDAAALVDMNGSIIYGNISTGIIRIG